MKWEMKVNELFRLEKEKKIGRYELRTGIIELCRELLKKQRINCAEEFFPAGSLHSLKDRSKSNEICKKRDAICDAAEPSFGKEKMIILPEDFEEWIDNPPDWDEYRDE